MILESPNTANITIINDKIYATDEDGKVFTLYPSARGKIRG